MPWPYSRIPEACIRILLLELAINSILHLFSTINTFYTIGSPESYDASGSTDYTTFWTCHSMLFCSEWYSKLAAFHVT